MFDAILLSRRNGQTDAAVARLDETTLPAGEVEVSVSYSSLNYKDALAITGRDPVIRQWPMVPGIDLAGIVIRSSDPTWRAGEHVFVTGCGLGETRWGGLAQRARLPGDIITRVPEGLSVWDSMAIGTAGLTASLCIAGIQRHGVLPGHGEILVTGAGGGVGSMAVALLADLGYEVTASTGRIEEEEYFRTVGAARIVGRELLSRPGKRIQGERWAAVIDTLGSYTLVNACASTRRGGVVTACGLAQGGDFAGTVMPFILRGVHLLGINAGIVDRRSRESAWQLLGRHLSRERLASMTVKIGLREAISQSQLLLSGRVRGRTVVDVHR